MFDAVYGPCDGVATSYGDTEGFGDFAVIVAEEWEIERVLALEKLEAICLITTDANDFGSGLLQMGEVVAKQAGLSGAATCESGWVEEYDDIFFADKIFGFPERAVVLVSLEAGCCVAFAEAVWAVRGVCEGKATGDSGGGCGEGDEDDKWSDRSTHRVTPQADILVEFSSASLLQRRGNGGLEQGGHLGAGLTEAGQTDCLRGGRYAGTVQPSNTEFLSREKTLGMGEQELAAGEEQSADSVQQSIRGAGFGFVAKGFQRWVQEFVDDSGDGGFDGVFLGWFEGGNFSVESIEFRATDFCPVFAESMDYGAGGAMMDFLNEGLSLCGDDVFGATDFAAAGLSVAFAGFFECIEVVEEDVVVDRGDFGIKVTWGGEIKDEDGVFAGEFSGGEESVACDQGL